jgi:hypothetical protein
MAKNMNKISSNIRGVGFLVLGMFIFSLQDVSVKWMGGDYPVLEIVTFRSLVALPLTLLLFRLEGGRGLPTTQRRKLEYVRGLFYFLSYTTHFMGLAALPLAESDLYALLRPGRYADAQTANDRQQCDNGLLQFAGLPGRHFCFDPAGHRSGRFPRRSPEYRFSFSALGQALPVGLGHYVGLGAGLGRGDVLFGARL